MDILVIAPDGGIDLSALGELPDTARVTVVSWQPSAQTLEGVTWVGVPQPFGRMAHSRSRFVAAASGNLVSRSVLRLSGFDEGVWFWKAVSKVPAAVEAARVARVIVAPNRDAVFTAWKWGHAAKAQGRPVAAVHGYPAARVAIDEASER